MLRLAWVFALPRKCRDNVPESVSETVQALGVEFNSIVLPEFSHISIFLAGVGLAIPVSVLERSNAAHVMSYTSCEFLSINVFLMRSMD